MVESTQIEPAASSPVLGGVVGLLSAVADPIRWQLVSQLSAGATRCVCELRTDPEVPPNLLSYHLKVLREAGLIVGSRRGRWIDYRLADDAVDRLHSALPTPNPEASCGCRRPGADLKVVER